MGVNNAATGKMISNILDGTTPPKKVKNALTLKVNGSIVAIFDGSEAKEIDISVKLYRHTVYLVFSNFDSDDSWCDQTGYAEFYSASSEKVETIEKLFELGGRGGLVKANLSGSIADGPVLLLSSDIKYDSERHVVTADGLFWNGSGNVYHSNYMIDAVYQITDTVTEEEL